MRRTLAVPGVIASLLVVGLLGTGLLAATPTDGAQVRRDVGSYSIPIGRIGDEVDYVVRVQDRLDKTQESGQDPRPYAMGFRVEGVGTAYDKTRTEHEALHLLVTEEDRFGLDTEEDLHTSVALDLATRTRIERSESFGSGWSYTFASYGPQFENPYSSSAYFSHPTPAFAWMMGVSGYAAVQYQGNELTVGQTFTESDLDGALGAVLASGGVPYPYTCCEPMDVPISFEYTRQVTAAGRIGSYDVIGIETHISLEYTRQYDLVPDRHWNEEQRMTVWMSPEVPYPVRIERTMWRESAEPIDYDAYNRLYSNDRNLDHSVSQDLVRYRPGGAPIPWKDGAGTPFSGENPRAERAPEGTFHPVSGAESPLAHSFDEALASIQGDATLADFTAWRRSQPEHYLIGAEYARDMPYQKGWRAVSPLEDRSLGTWTMIFAVPGELGAPDQAYVVTSTLLEAEGVVNAEWGATAVHDARDRDRPLSMDDLRPSPVTFAYVIDAYGGTVPTPDSGLPVSSLRWGYEAQWHSYLPDFRDFAPLVPDIRVEGTPHVFRGIYVEGERTEPYVDGVPDEGAFEHATQWAWVEANGNLTDAGHERWVDWYPVTIRAVPDHVWEAVEIRQTADRAAPAPYPDPLPLLLFAAVPASLLSIIFFTYFLPLLKYFGARFLGAPMYARISRDAILDHAARDKIASRIADEPGITASELHDVFGGSYEGIVYHLRVLEKNHMVSSLRDGRHKRFFKSDGIDWSDRRALGVLRNERTKRFYEIVTENPGVSRRRVAELLGVTAPALYFHERRLAQSGLIGRASNGRRVRYVPAHVTA